MGNNKKFVILNIVLAIIIIVLGGIIAFMALDKDDTSAEKKGINSSNTVLSENSEGSESFEEIGENEKNDEINNETNNNSNNKPDNNTTVNDNSNKENEESNKEDIEYVKSTIKRYYELLSKRNMKNTLLLSELDLKVQTVQDSQNAPSEYKEHPNGYSWTGIKYSDFTNPMWYISDNVKKVEFSDFVNYNGYLYLNDEKYWELNGNNASNSYEYEIQSINVDEISQYECVCTVSYKTTKADTIKKSKITLVRGNGDFVINSVENITNSNSVTQNSVIGTYRNKSEDNNSYHDANIIISNQTNSSIDFKLSAVHGTDIEHVNIGEVSGTAKKTGTDIYEYEETIDGKTCKITFEFTAHRAFEYVTVKEAYPDGINPYGGHNVYFEGDYEKIS